MIHNTTIEKGRGLYIHIPFCKSKCYYCDFNSYSGQEGLFSAYFDALKREIQLYSEKLKDSDIETIFIGGGTPSLVEPGYLYDVLNTVRHCFKVKPCAEITVETNPGTLSYEKVTAYRAIGINRMSIGLQTWQNSLLKSIGRIHTREEFVENYKQARKSGFKNINIDLIFGLPGQTFENWEETLNHVIELHPEHISCYSLKIEEGTVFGNQYECGELHAFDDELDREMYYLAVEKLEKVGLKQYEISNFAKPGYECRHNLIYWKAEEYLGVGAGAHSYLASERFNNIYGVEEYIEWMSQNTIPVENKEYITEKESISEYVILGLRLTSGICLREFEQRYGVALMELYEEKIKKFMHMQWVEIEKDRLKLTKKGMDLANEVMMEFL